jgi:hypothetical protein
MDEKSEKAFDLVMKIAERSGSVEGVAVIAEALKARAISRLADALNRFLDEAIKKG